MLDLYEMLIATRSAEHDLWSCDATRHQRTSLEYGEPRHRGRIVQREPRGD